MVARIEIFTKVYDSRAAAKIKQIQNVGFKVNELAYVDVYTIEKNFSETQLKQVAERLTNPVTQEFVIKTDENVILVSEAHPESAIKNKDFGQAPIQEESSALDKVGARMTGNWQKDINFDLALEIGFLPGVTDNIAHTTKQLIEDLLKIQFKDEENVYTSQLFLISGKVFLKDAQSIGESLANTLIQRIHYKDFKQYLNEGGMDLIIPKVSLNQVQKVLEVDLDVPDEELTKIGKEGILDSSGKRRGPLALDLTYMKTIQNYFKSQKRNPTDIELEALAQTWSEHCKHTIFADPIDDIKEGLFKKYIKGATEKIIRGKGEGGRGKFVAKVFNDNSGAIIFDDEYLVTHKVETHNTPSALDPFGGAITGIVGVNRDALGFGLGAKPILNTYGFCFADPDDESPLYRDEDLTQKMLPPRRIIEGVIAGVNAGGNQSGIPTPQGFLYFDKRYKGKPLVFCGTVGLIPRKINNRDATDKKAENGDYIVMLGGKVGIDGIHGATFSSEALDSVSPSTAVQIGDPITQKKFSDALVCEAREMGLFNSITDNGAGGLSSSVPEMARESGGCEVWLEKIPLKYPGLEPWQIWISESQERMTLSIPKDKWKKFDELMRRRGNEAWIIGEFNDSRKCIIKYKDEVILDLEMEFLHEGLPKENQISKIKYQKWEEPKIKEQKDLTQSFIDMVGRLNTCGYDFISTQFDHTVQGLAVTYPISGKGRVNAEFAVARPRLGSERGIVLSQALYPHYSDIDTYHMAASAVDTAFKNAVIAGADPEKIALLDNFCWASSNEEESLGQLKRACEACFDYAVFYSAPYISGKDSMFNDFKGFDESKNPVKISVPKSLLITSIGIIEDVKNAVTLDFKIPGDLIYILGETFEELGGSEYFRYLGDYIGNTVPKVDAKKNLKLYKSLANAIKLGLISSGIGVNIGGLGVALAKSATAGKLGFELSLKDLPGKVSRDDFALFSESQGRILVSIDPNKSREFEKVMKGNYFKEIGRVKEGNEVKVNGMDGKPIIKTTVIKALENYKERFKDW